MQVKITEWNEITKLCVIQFFRGLFLISPVVVFFYQQRGLNYFQILSLESVFVLFMLLFEIPTGLFADKYGRKLSIIIGSLLIGTESIIYLFANNYIIFAISYAISAIGLTFLSGTVEAFIYDHLKSHKLEGEMKKAMGMYGASASLAGMVAPILGSLIAKDLLSEQFTILLIISAFSAFIAFLLSFLLKDTKKRYVEEDNPLQLLKDGFNVLKNNSSLMRIVLLAIFTSPFFFVLSYLFQPYLRQANVGIAWFGPILSISLLAAAMFQKYAYKFEKVLGMTKAILLITIIPGVLYLLMSAIFSPVLSTMLFIILQGTIGLREPLFADYKNIHIPSRVRATTLSIISMFTSFYLIIMRLIIGKLADINLAYAFLLMGGVIILAALFLKINKDQT